MNGERANEPAGEEFEARIGDKSIRLRGRDPLHILIVLVILVLTGVSALMVYLLVEHKDDAKVAQSTFVATIKEVSTANTAALKELTGAQREGNTTAREQNCLLRFTQAERQQNADFCRQMGRTQ